MKRKERIRDKYWDEKRPGVNVDFVEVSLPEAEIDAFLKKYASQFVRFKENELSTSALLANRKKRDKMMYKIYRAASLVLTHRQFQVFILRYKLGLLETEIARQINVIQPYVSTILQRCHSKIRQALHFEAKKKRGCKKRPKNNKKSPKPLKIRHF